MPVPRRMVLTQTVIETGIEEACRDDIGKYSIDSAFEKGVEIDLSK